MRTDLEIALEAMASRLQVEATGSAYDIFSGLSRACVDGAKALRDAYRPDTELRRNVRGLLDAIANDDGQNTDYYFNMVQDLMDQPPPEEER